MSKLASVFVLAVTLAGCGSERADVLATTQSSRHPVTIVVDASLSNDLIDALSDSGLTDQGAPGMMRLRADAIRCSAAVVPSPVPQCTITKDRSFINVPENPAKTIYDILMLSGAEASHGPVGVLRAIVYDLECTRSVVPNAVGTCTFKVPR